MIRFPAAPSNYTRGRPPAIRLDTIVLHVTEGKGAAQWFQDPAAHASAHYLVLPTGEVVQCVQESDTAWHAGNWSVNARSIGIEVEGHCADPAMWTTPVLAALLALCADLCRRYRIKPVRQIPGVIGHCDVPNPHDPSKRGGLDGHTDPGALFPFKSFLADLASRLERVA